MELSPPPFYHSFYQAWPMRRLSDVCYSGALDAPENLESCFSHLWFDASARNARKLFASTCSRLQLHTDLHV